MNIAVVDRIRETLERKDGISADVMQPHATAYSLLVESLNDRLANCVSLLRKGLRSEALQHASIQPSLLEQCERLDFAELDEWIEILKFFHIRVPRLLNREAVRQLQEAVIEVQPLNELLRQHRRYAIAKAPLEWRLKVLRRISAVDDLNGVWRKDIESWERVRLREIDVEFAHAVQEDNSERCVVLANELLSKDWIVPPTADVLANAKGVLDRTRFRTQSLEVRAIAEQLHLAYRSNDTASGQRLRESFRELLSAMTREPPQETLGLAEPALRWLEQCDQLAFEQELQVRAVAALEDLIDHGESIHDLENAYAIATRNGRQIKETTENRYRSATRKLRKRAFRRLTMTVAVVAVFAGCIVVAFGVLYLRTRHLQQVRLASETLGNYINEGKTEEAWKYSSTLTQAVLKSREVSEVVGELEAKTNADREQDDRISLLDTQAKRNVAEIETSVLATAEANARNSEEKRRIATYREQREAIDRAKINAMLLELRSEISKIDSELNKFDDPRSKVLVPRDLIPALEEISLLRKRYAIAGAAAMAQIDTLEQRTIKLQEALRKAQLARQAEEQAIRRICNATDLQSLRDALVSYPQDVQASPYSREVKLAAAEIQLWDRLSQWNQLTTSVAGYLDSPEVRAIDGILNQLEVIEKYLPSNPLLPNPGEIGALLIKTREREQAIDDLSEGLACDLRRVLCTVVGTEGKNLPPRRYFLHADEASKVVNLANPGINVVVSSDGGIGLVGFIGKPSIIREPSATYEDLVSHLVNNRLEILVDWDAQLLKLIGATLKKKELDAGVKELIATQLLHTLVRGSQYMSERLLDKLEILEQRQGDMDGWYLPSEFETALPGSLSNEIEPALSSAYRGRSTAVRPLLALSQKQMVHVGMVITTEDGEREPHLVKLLEANGRLAIIQQNGNDIDAGEIVFVGECSAGNIQLYPTEKQHLNLGRPVFFLASEQLNTAR